MTEGAKKPSEMVTYRRDLGGGVGESGLDLFGLMQYLDAEAERREAFERDVLERLESLENPEAERLVPGEFKESVLARGTAKPVTVSTPEEWRTLFGQHSTPPASLTDPAPLCLVAGAVGTPCSDRLPEAQTRVMFFVPSRVPPQRWRTGFFFPNGYNVTSKFAEWADDEQTHEMCSVTYTADQVTHWMPLPGEPSNA